MSEVEMTSSERRSHRLDAFPAAAIRLSRGLERNRERIAEQEGLSASELRALFYIGKHISVTPKQLAEHMHITTAAITFISRRLVDADMLVRVAHPGDRRSIFLELTPLAHSALERIHAEFTAMVRSATVSLDSRELDDFTRYLEVTATAIAGHTAGRSRARGALAL